jgi:hypothetical protein
VLEDPVPGMCQRFIRPGRRTHSFPDALTLPTKTEVCADSRWGTKLCALPCHVGSHPSINLRFRVGWLGVSSSTFIKTARDTDPSVHLLANS